MTNTEIGPSSNFIFKPYILKFECLPGYCVRLRYFATSCGLALTANYLGKSRLSWGYPSGLAKVSKFYGAAVPVVDNLISEHTLYSLMRPFMPSGMAECLFQHFYGDAVRGVHMMAGFARLGSISRWSLSICISCVSEDLQQHGFTYWRNGHIVPGLALCPYHKTPLYSYCQECESGYRHSKKIWLPRVNCMCGQKLRLVRPLLTASAYASEAALSESVRQVLGGELPDFVDDKLVLACIKRKVELCIQGGPRSVLSHIENTIEGSTLNAYGLNLKKNGSIYLCIKGLRLPRNPLQNLIVINALFGSLSEFIESLSKVTELVSVNNICVATNYSGTSTTSRVAMRYENWEKLDIFHRNELIEKYRARVLRLKQKNY